MKTRRKSKINEKGEEIVGWIVKENLNLNILLIIWAKYYAEDFKKRQK